MSTAWATLLPLATVGTDRQAAVLPAWPGEVGRLVAQVARREDNAASGVLRVAAVLATCSLAGAQGTPWLDLLPAEAPNDTLPALSEGSLLASVSWALHASSTPGSAGSCAGCSTGARR